MYNIGAPVLLGYRNVYDHKYAHIYIITLL